MMRRACNSWRSLLFCVYLSLIVSDNAMLELGNPELFAYTRPSTAFHLEIDENNPAQLIAAYVSSLGVIRQNDSEPRKIVGGSTKGYQDGKGEDAQFKLITSFAQLNTTHIALVDHESHCLRMVDRPQRSATTLAGQCGQPGHIDGSLLSSKFYQPYNMIKTNNNSLLVTDHNNNAIREVNLTTGVVSTFLQSDELEFPIDLVLDEDSGIIYVTLRFKLVYVDSERNVHEISSDRGDKIVMFSSNEMVISDNRRDFENNGYKARIKRLARLEDDTRGEPQFNVTVLLEWPIANEPTLAIQLNKADKKLYASERQVVRRANFRVDGDPMFPTTTTTSTTAEAPSPSPSRITASTRTNLTHQRQETKTTIMTTTGQPTATTYGLSGAGYAGIGICLLCVIVIACASVYFIKRNRKLRKRHCVTEVRHPDWTTQASVDEENRKNLQINTWMEDAENVGTTYDSIPADRVAEPGREYDTLLTGNTDVEMRELRNNRRTRMRSDEESLLSRQASCFEVRPEPPSEDMLHKPNPGAVGSMTNVAVLVEESEEEEDSHEYNTAAYPYSRAFDHFSRPNLFQSVQPSDAVLHYDPNLHSPLTNHEHMPNNSLQHLPPEDIVPIDAHSTYLFPGQIYQSTRATLEAQQPQTSIAFEENF